MFTFGREETWFSCELTTGKWGKCTASQQQLCDELFCNLQWHFPLFPLFFSLAAKCCFASWGRQLCATGRCLRVLVRIFSFFFFLSYLVIERRTVQLDKGKEKFIRFLLRNIQSERLSSSCPHHDSSSSSRCCSHGEHPSAGNYLTLPCVYLLIISIISLFWSLQISHR